MQEDNKIDFSAIGMEDFTFFLRFADKEKLREAASPLRYDAAQLATKLARITAELTRVNNRLSLINTFLESSTPGEDTTPPPAAKDTPTAPASDDETGKADEVDLVAHGVDEKVGEAKEQVKQKLQRVRKDRGSLEDRNSLIVQITQDADNWLYRTEYEAKFKDTDFIDETDNIKDVVRGFLRQTVKDTRIVSKTAYRVAANNKVVTATLYGLPSFLLPENQDNYEEKWREKVRKLGMFLTESDAAKSKQGGQTELNVS